MASTNVLHKLTSFAPRGLLWVLASRPNAKKQARCLLLCDPFGARTAPEDRRLWQALTCCISSLRSRLEAYYGSWPLAQTQKSRLVACYLVIRLGLELRLRTGACGKH